MSPDKTSTRRIVIVLGLVSLVSFSFFGFVVIPGSAQSTTSNPTPQPTETPEQADELVYDFEGSTLEIQNVTWDNGRVELLMSSSDDEQFAIIDSGVVQSGGQGQVPVQMYDIDGGETRRITFETAEEPIITVSTSSDLWYSSGDADLITVISQSPTVQLIRWAGVSGSIGVLLSTGLDVGFRRRRHENTYKELTSEERKNIEEDRVEGIIGRLRQSLSNNKGLVVLGIGISIYGLGMIFGLAPSPGAVWSGMSDTQRVLTSGTVVFSILSILPAHILIERIWSPNKVYVYDVDASEIIDNNRGMDDTSVAVYSGAPDTVADMDIRGDDDRGKSRARTPGGDAVVVREFDPIKNKASGTWPGLADDVELVAHQSMIENNRNELLETAQLGKNLLAKMQSINESSQVAALLAIDKNIRESLSVDPEPINDILRDAAPEDSMWDDFFSDYISDDDEDTEDDEMEDGKA